MGSKSIREFDGKSLLYKWFNENSEIKLNNNVAKVIIGKEKPSLPWLESSKLVAKPDELIKRRGKSSLILLNADWKQAHEWIESYKNKEVQVEHAKGVLNHFLVEPFIPHAKEEEFYVCLQSIREGTEILFCSQGGVDVGNVDEKAERLTVLTDDSLSIEQALPLLKGIPESKKQIVAKFVADLFTFYYHYNFTYLEINPLVVTQDGAVYPLDFAAKLDSTAEYLDRWGKIPFPAPFGRTQTSEEVYVAELDSKTGASLKLTILNAKGRIWTMVAGGGASVIYADTISDLGFGTELANYGEYSGDPSEALTYEYAKTIMTLMTKHYDNKGKILIIGGGIANFTDVAETFKGIIRAINELQDRLREHNVSIYVRRGGPNYQEGLRLMVDCGYACNLSIQVFGPETHLTSVVSYALGIKEVPQEEEENPKESLRQSWKKSGQHQTQSEIPESKQEETPVKAESEVKDSSASYNLYTQDTVTVIYGMQNSAVQNMLDFDHVSNRKKPSVAAMIYPFSGNHYQKFYWGSSEILIPVYQSMGDCFKKHPEVDVVINFASFRSVFDSVSETLNYPQIKTIAIIAEGVPESQTKSLIKKANEKGVTIVGPATVGGIKPGVLRIGNTGGMIDNIISSKLYRPGSVAYVSRSGGMSNELNNILSRNTDGVYEGVAIGGDRYPGTTFLDHILRYEKNPDIKIIVLLGEVGGIEEYKIMEYMKEKKITKPLVAWCIGTCAKMFPYDVQFGHAGALAKGNLETADAKNNAFKEAGAIVPTSFEEFGATIKTLYDNMVKEGKIVPKREPDVPNIPMEYTWAKKMGIFRKPSNFVSSISDERGEELVYGGMPISKIFDEDLGIGGVISLLWFKRRLPNYATKFVEMALMIVADHGPAVSGAHNTIVTARAGKDLVSSVVSGLLTIGPRFGGAIDGAAEQFSWAYDTNQSPKQFVAEMRKQNKLILGIGHKIKSAENADKRVQILKEYAFKHFPKTDLLKYALEVEKVTTAKKSNLILNVDGVIGVCFVDLLRSSGAFTEEEAEKYIKQGFLNGLFVLGRTIGLIGHYLDQIRLKQPLYRHPWEDITYADNASFL